jgi:hypothetical protein
MDPPNEASREADWEADLEADEVELVENLNDLVQVIERRQHYR